MAPISRQTFRRRFRRLESPARERFLVDLFRASGWRTNRHDGTVVLVRDDPVPARRVVRLEAGSDEEASVDEDTPRIVRSAGTGVSAPPAVNEVWILDPDDLYERLRYGISPERSTQLVDTHLRDSRRWRTLRSITNWGLRVTDRERGRRKRDARRPWRTGVLLVILVAAALAPVTGASGGGSGPSLAYADGKGPVRAVVSCPPPPTDVSPRSIQPQLGSQLPPDLAYNG